MNDKAGARVQTLSCDLFREWGPRIGVDEATTESVLDYHAEAFVSGLKTIDVDFDGLPDIAAVRDFGAKWAKYCIWLFDANQGRFIQNPLSHQLEDLENLTVDAERRQIVAFDIGPTDPTRDEYNIDDRSVVRNGQRRLLPARSCELDTSAIGETSKTVTIVTYVDGHAVVQRRSISIDCRDVCGDGCPAVPEKNRTPLNRLRRNWIEAGLDRSAYTDRKCPPNPAVRQPVMD